MTLNLTIETAGPDRRARRLLLSDGAPDPVWERTTSAAVVKILALAAGPFDKDTVELESNLRTAENELSKERAYTLLAYRARSRFELRKRLVDDGYPPALASAVVERIAEMGYLDDRAFAESLVRMKMASGWGERKIRRALVEKGVDDLLVDEVCLEYLGADDEFERALQLVSGKPCVTRKERDRLLRRIVSRGFSPGVAYSVLRAVQSDDEDASDDAF